VPRSPALALALALAACTASGPAAPPPPAASAPPPAPLPTLAAPATPPPPPTAEPAPDAGDPEPRVDLVPTLFPEAASTPPGVPGCLKVEDARDRAHCLISTRFEADAEAAKIAIDLFDATGSVAGVEVDQEMDGGFRGRIHIVPEVPIGPHRRHLAWIAGASRDFDAFFERLAAGAPAPVRYRHRPLAFRFFRSVNRTTPSAYAGTWTVSYNVVGSLLVSADAVRETLFHELFHVNDAAHGDWSPRNLRATFDAIVARCGTRMACLRPYAPTDTTVRGGTYYAFQPDNGEAVHEYAAELALRYYREQRAAQRGEAPGRPSFKCGPEENRRSWNAVAAEFFGGADAVPPCRGG
jgi:hypothetical protein